MFVDHNVDRSSYLSYTYRKVEIYEVNRAQYTLSSRKLLYVVSTSPRALLHLPLSTDKRVHTIATEIDI